MDWLNKLGQWIPLFRRKQEGPVGDMSGPARDEYYAQLGRWYDELDNRREFKQMNSPSCSGCNCGRRA